MKVGIQGGKGAYHEIAAKQFYKQPDLVYLETFSELFAALSDGVVDVAIAAIANNRSQFITDTYEHITNHGHKFQIVGETYIRIEHALLGTPNSSLKTIKTVHSQVPALLQCKHFLENKLPEANLVEEHDTAGSAKMVAESNDRSKTAIASLATADMYGLKVLARAIQDDPDNITRFLSLRRTGDKTDVAGANKTTLLLHTAQKAGSLAQALNLFADAKINLTSLQSKLIPNSAFEMVFFVEFDAGIHEKRTKNTLNALTEIGYSYELLGSYQKSHIPLKI